MTTRVIRTDAEIDGLARLLRSRKLPMTVTITAGAQRTDALALKRAFEAKENQLGEN